jgi:hypothetical protein
VLVDVAVWACSLRRVVREGRSLGFLDAVEAIEAALLSVADRAV